MFFPIHPIAQRFLSSAFVITSLLLVNSGPAAAAPSNVPPDAAAEEQKAAMAKLAYMAGDWKGTGWMNMPHGRVNFHGGEIVQRKLEGLALLVEGSFFHRDPATGKDVPSHTTLGVISFDPQSKTYRFRTWLATGTTGERELKLIPDGWQWDITHPRGTMRYTTIFKDGEWFEIGERSTDGATWTKFFEMRLKKSSK